MSRLVSVLALCASLLAAAPALAQSTRTITYDAKAIVHVNAKLRFTTLIVLPDAEQILDFVCGDKEFWVVSGAQNLAYVKPAKAGATTNLNLVTASGRVYSFLLAEGNADPDLKLYIDPDESMLSVTAPPRFYTGDQVEAYKQDAERAKAQASADIEAAGKRADDAILKFQSTYPLTLEFPYALKGNGKPFDVVAIFHDDKFTYIKSDATELPALYEVVDGTPKLVNFQVERGCYIVSKVLDHAYLALGAKQMHFDRVQ